jgi:hypothetical protein
MNWKSLRIRPLGVDDQEFEADPGDRAVLERPTGMNFAISALLRRRATLRV